MPARIRPSPRRWLRGFGPAPGSRLFAVLDGSAPLLSAVQSAWPDALIQRCLVHKERNLYGYLRQGDHAEAARLWRRLRLAQGKLAGNEALAELRGFLATRNSAALASLEEAGEHLVTLHQLDVPATLNLSLLSTNAIENVMRNYRGQTTKVTRWLPATNQLSRPRQAGAALLHVEAPGLPGPHQGPRGSPHAPEKPRPAVAHFRGWRELPPPLPETYVSCSIHQSLKPIPTPPSTQNF